MQVIMRDRSVAAPQQFTEHVRKSTFLLNNVIIRHRSRAVYEAQRRGDVERHIEQVSQLRNLLAPGTANEHHQRLTANDGITPFD